jgi:hypothetical protein
LDGKYSNYTQNEIFPVAVSAGSNITTSLSRNELFNVYEEQTTTDESGNSTTTRVVVGTRTIRIPGQLISGIYYKTQIQKTQVVTENPIALLFKNLRGILVDLGFVYQSPSTVPTVIATGYDNVTTRYQSITDAGYNPADLVNP